VDIAVLKITPHHGSSASMNEQNNGIRHKGRLQLEDKQDTKDNSATDHEEHRTCLPVATLGDSNHLTVGQLVIAVGSPGGLDNTITMGIVSGLERSSAMVGIPHKKVDYIQTDAAINPGNSGGPLVDVATGQVVGINAAIRAHMEGTSFAMPINRVREIMYQLSEGKHVQHGYLGMLLATCTPQWARQNNLGVGSSQSSSRKSRSSTSSAGHTKLPEIYGALVHRVFLHNPAALGGIKENDVVLEINGTPILSSDEAQRLIDVAPIASMRNFCFLFHLLFFYLFVRCLSFLCELVLSNISELYVLVRICCCQFYVVNNDCN
jgi:S1-C subfamily serine protease